MVQQRDGVGQVDEHVAIEIQHGKTRLLAGVIRAARRRPVAWFASS